jgi:hypothetical protein
MTRHCDVCDRPVACLTRGIAFGIETWACCQCRQVADCDECAAAKDDEVKR